ncbi:MAG: helix-turn-helix domain-containing protein [Alphaproteobacteria bacterium]
MPKTLRIRRSYLVAIEDGRFDQMPGPTYAPWLRSVLCGLSGP